MKTTEARLCPDKKFIKDLNNILIDADVEYEDWVKTENNGKDDIVELVDILNYNNCDSMPISFHSNPDPRQDENEWASAVADWSTTSGEHVDVVLHADNITGYYNFADMQEILLKMIAHETIHFNQYSRMGKEGLASYKSGHQKGTELINKGGTERDWMRCYLRDMHEVMAYGRDLAVDIAETANPQEVLRNAEGFINDLPVYRRYRSIFNKDTPQIKSLLKYASQYLADLLKEKELNEFNTIKRNIT